MTRVIVKTTAGITANIEADGIRTDGDFIKVTNGSDMVGMFDIGSVIFVYMTVKTKTSGGENT